VSVVLGIFYAWSASPKFQADALIQIEERKGSGIAGLQEVATALNVGPSPTAGEIEIIKSREVVGQAVDSLGLSIDVEVDHKAPYFFSRFDRANDWHPQSLAPVLLGLTHFAWGGQHLSVPEFQLPTEALGKSLRVTALEPGRWELSDGNGEKWATGMVGVLADLDINGRPGRILISSLLAQSGNSFTVRKRSTFDAYKSVLRNLKVSEVGRQSSVVRITYEDRDPYQAASVVNEIAKAYLKQNVARRSEEADKSLNFLEQQLPELKLSVEKSEEAFNAYRLARHSVDLGKEADSLLAQSVDLEKQNVEAELQRQNLSERFQPSHPEIQAVHAEIATLSQARDKLADQIKRLPETEQEAFRLERDVKVNTDLYISLLNNAQQLKVAKAGTIGNANVIDFSVPEGEPVSPQKGIIVSFSLVFGIVLAICAALLRASLDLTFRDAAELDLLTGIPTYATVPESKNVERIAKASNANRRGVKLGEIRLLHQTAPDDPAIEALRGMRMGLQFAMADARNNVIAITGAIQAQGKTFISSNLSSVLAAVETKVLLIDADLRRPRLNEEFGLTRSPGLSELLSGRSSIQEVVRRAVLPNLDLICSGAVPPNPSELLLKPMLAEVIEELSSQYDYILIDTPPVLPVGDTLAIAKCAGAVFLVLRAEKSTLRQLTEARKRFATIGVSISGIIFNGVKLSRAGAQYRYQYLYN
jgi:tyrosine-protein kinase Etk/Wzc